MDDECELCCVLVRLCSGSRDKHGCSSRSLKHTCYWRLAHSVCVYKYHSLRLSLSSPLLSSIQSFLSRLFLLPFFPAPKVRLCDIITVLPALVMMWKWRRGKYSWHLPLTLVWLHRCYHGYTWPVFVGCRDAPQQLFACQGALYCKLFNGLLNWGER